MIVLATLALLAPTTAQADDVYTIIVKKQEQKAKGRWSLAEWLDTRDKMRLMDLWLALHSPSPYEFFIGGDWRQEDSSALGKQMAVDVYAAAYASIFGLEVHKSFTSVDETLAQFNLRIFGYHAQGTNITGHAGLRFEKKPDDLRNAFAGISANIYFTRFFGIEGLWRHHFTSVPGTTPYRVSGDHFLGGAFIDFKFVRVYGNYFSKPETLDTGTTSTTRTRTGFSAGTRFYF